MQDGICLQLLLVTLIIISRQCIPLRCHALHPPLPSSLGLGTLGVHLVLEDPLTLLLGLGLVDLECVRLTRKCMRDRTHVLYESALVLEGVTLAVLVEFVVQVLVDLASSSVLAEQPTENTLATHPDHLTVRTLAYWFHCDNRGLVWQVVAAKGGFLSTLTSACEHPWYPSSYRSPDDGQYSALREARELEHESAWQPACG
jgi:hypothetical protein